MAWRTKMKRFLNTTISVFLILGIIFIPLQFGSFGFQEALTHFLFYPLVSFFEKIIFPTANPLPFSSDTRSFYILFFVLMLIAILGAIFLCFHKKRYRIPVYARTFFIYYLVFILLKYGFEKVFKTQFYIPEPNILYSEFGQLQPDILYWSTLGTARGYVMALGVVEICAALLLFFRRTRLMGLLITAAILINIILVNFGFDISVKAFSLFLFFGNIYCLIPYLKPLFSFFVVKKTVSFKIENVNFPKNNAKKVLLKIFIIVAFLIEILYPYAVSGNYNDDTILRPKLHGAYEVFYFSNNNETLKKSQYPFTRLFFHRRNYLILQDSLGKMNEYHYQTNINSEIIIEDYNRKKTVLIYSFNAEDSILKMKFPDNLMLNAKMLPWKSLPALNSNFHFTVDELFIKNE